MKSLLSIGPVPLTWNQPHLLEPYFELRTDGEVIGTLKFRNSFGSLAEGTTAKGNWSFKRQGFLKTIVTIRKTGYEENLAVYFNNTWSEGGTLQIPSGKKYFANSNFWHAQFEFTDESGTPCIRYTNISGFKLHSGMEILAPAITLEATPWMVLLGWYLAVMNSRDGEMVAAMF